MKNIYFLFTLFFSSILTAQISDFNSTNFTIADNIAKLNERENLNNLPILSYKLTNKLNTDVEKFRAIFYWVCDNIKADDHQNTKIKNSRKKLQNDSLAYIEWNRQFGKKALKELLKYKKTTCSGYAYLLKELCFFANIECKIINGYGRTIDENVESLDLANHSWNAVKLDNKWYLCDATWASGYSDSKSNFIKEYNNGYFLSDPNLFAKNHIPFEKKWLLLNDATQINGNIPPIVYGETFKLNINPITPDKMVVNCKEGDVVTFSFKNLNNKNYNPSLVELIREKEILYDIYNIQHNNGLTTFKYRFPKNGNFDVHLKAENYIIATYIIKVENN
ncbi:transglutaminase domain-containing protein [Flavobacterium enshiense]|uniref:transglutaminase domain-containing protein n=1 Tax=Flavobacterium enshiense TaxID=1341165 RepID=UPI00345DC6C5